MGGELAIRELEVLAREEGGICADTALSLGDIDEGLQGVQERRGAAGLEDDLVGIDEERGLGEDVRVEVRVRRSSNDSAVDGI